MEERTSDSGSCDPETTNSGWWPSGLLENLQSVSLSSKDDTPIVRGSPHGFRYADMSAEGASQTLWATGTYSGVIPSGFYSVIPVSNS